MGTSKIEWTDRVWNPITGCTPVSPGCEHCYARRMATRLAGRCGYDAQEPFKPTFRPERLSEPDKWRKPCRIFVGSMGDVWHEAIEQIQIAGIFDAPRDNPEHTFIFLTKRPERMAHMARSGSWLEPWPSNAWAGVSVENQAAADERIPALLRVPARVRFLSCEPLLGPVTLRPEWLAGLHWIIIGGETGPGARQMAGKWAHALKDQAKAAGIPVFFKGWGTFLLTKTDPHYHLLAGARIQEWPEVTP